MRYAVVALAPAEQQQMADYFSTLVGHGLQIVYAGYAPRMWIVSYQGTPRQLTDLLWPDDTPRDEHALHVGVVIRIPDSASINGLAARELWDLFHDS